MKNGEIAPNGGLKMRDYFKINNSKLTLGILGLSLFIYNFSFSSNDLYLHQNLGKAFYENEDYEKAIQEFEECLIIDPQSASNHINLGLALLRATQYEKAFEELEKARKTAGQEMITAPLNLYIAYNLGLLLKREERYGEAILELEKVRKADPEDVATLYNLGLLYKQTGNHQEAENAFQEAVERDPFHTSGYYQLYTLLKQRGMKEEAEKELNLFRDLRASPWAKVEGTPETLEKGKYTKIILSAPKGSIDERHILVEFQDVTESAGITTTSGSDAVFFDYDNDGDLDLYLVNAERNPNVLYSNNGDGTFTNVTAKAGVEHSGPYNDCVVGDYDNDGNTDLYVIGVESNVLYQNNGNGTFSDITEKTVRKNYSVGREAMFVDYDHDGDLDIYEVNFDIYTDSPLKPTKGTTNFLHRNNGKSTPFTEVSKEGGVDGGYSRSTGAVMSDFDNDDDIDLYVVNEYQPNMLFTNLRMGQFRNIASSTSTDLLVDGRAEVGDVDNDGDMDLFIAGTNNVLLLNKGDGTFEKDTLFPESSGLDAHFFDYDNDGTLDLFVSTRVNNHLYKNKGNGRYSDACKRTGIDTTDMKNSRKVITGPPTLLRNNGGNHNNRLKITLEGTRSNRMGIGAKVEVRQGLFYQKKEVTQLPIVFGVGSRKVMDVVRVVWPTGIIQNLTNVSVDKPLHIREKPIVHGSCPFLYAWNGEEFNFVTDLIWRSMLGMFIGNQSVVFPDAAEEYVKIPGSSLVPKDGGYLLRITHELWEISFVDEVKLLVVDSPPEVLEVHLDERFIPPPFPPFEIFPVTKKIYPTSAIDEKGRDLLPLLLARDGKDFSYFERTHYVGITKPHDLILDFNEASSLKLKASSSVHLFLYGWLVPTSTSTNFAISQATSGGLKPILPSLQVPNEEGDWETVVDPLWFPAGRNKMMVVNLTGKFLCNDFRVKITTTMEIHWDEAFLTASAFRIPPAMSSTPRSLRLEESGVEWHPASSLPAGRHGIQISTLSPTSADLNFHGFSKAIQTEPGWPSIQPDYNEFTTSKFWRNAKGYYTRYGEVTPLLQKSDNQYVIMKSGDEIALSFRADEAPPLPDGWQRDYILYTNGWIKESEMNGLTAQTVEPLPFHGMKKYPYEEDESYPYDKEHLDYLGIYNTRFVTK
jgi:Flp pilus assembly protein TadD